MSADKKSPMTQPIAADDERGLCPTCGATCLVSYLRDEPSFSYDGKVHADLAEANSALYDEQCGITAELRAQELDSLRTQIAALTEQVEGFRRERLEAMRTLWLVVFDLPGDARIPAYRVERFDPSRAMLTQSRDFETGEWVISAKFGAPTAIANAAILSASDPSTAKEGTK